MKTRLLIIIGLVIVGIFVGSYTVNVMQNIEDQKSREEWMKNRSELMNLLSEQKKCEEIGGTWFDQHCVITEKTSAKSELTQEQLNYIQNCDPLLHKETLPDVTIETETQWYDLQYCMWRPHYPDLSHIEDKDLMNNHAYCVELFNTLYDFHTSPSPDCGLQRYNEDGTPRAICEPAPFGSSLSNDENLKNTECKENYKDWAYLTKDDTMVHTLYGDWLAPKLNLFTSKSVYDLGDDVYIEGRIRNVVQDYATVLIEIPYNQEIHQDIFTLELDERGKFQYTFHIDVRWDEGKYNMKVIDPPFDEIISFGVK